MLKGDIAVRNLAEFVFRQGDLYSSSGGRRADAQDGIRLQQRLGAERVRAEPAYQTEVSVKLPWSCLGSDRTLHGRIDGVIATDDGVVLEEFKCCGRLPPAADPVDSGQLLIYAGMYVASGAAGDAITSLKLRLVYCEPEQTVEQVFEQTLTPAQAIAALSWVLLCWETRLARHQQRLMQRQAWLDALTFPMAEFRPFQQALARRVYRAVRDREHLLLEAPTGSGKTLGVLFPSLKALQFNDQLFFLTSRNAGARAAITAARQLQPQDRLLATVEITAKEKVCLVEGMPCDPERCAYAAGYFDRVGAAVDEILDAGLADRTSILAVAERHRVCPFELSLDAARWADLIIGDYNYLLDPIVRLQRFSGHQDLHLLVDEAHQLTPRVRDMLSVDVSRSTVRAASKSGHAALGKRIASIDRALLALRRENGQGEHQAASFDALNRAISRFMETIAALEIKLAEHPQLRALCFEAARWQRAASWIEPGRFRRIAVVDGRSVRARWQCVDPSPHIRLVFDGHGASIRFSATVSPLALYQRLHGFSDGPAERCGSPFDPSQIAVLIVPDIATYFRQRQASVAGLVQTLADLIKMKPGRYLVALPSFHYLDLVVTRFMLSHPQQLALAQQPGQTAAAVENLLQQFGAAQEATLFIVSGGMLGESIDFSDIRLQGVVLVGLGLPPPSLAQDLLAEYFDADQGSGWGQRVAYLQPALVKGIQAAGRLIRSREDRGIICLIDARFNAAEVRQFFPNIWQPELVPARQVGTRAAEFWQRSQTTHMQRIDTDK